MANAEDKKTTERKLELERKKAKLAEIRTQKKRIEDESIRRRTLMPGDRPTAGGRDQSPGKQSRPNIVPS
jgi:hypothetical protein